MYEGKPIIKVQKHGGLFLDLWLQTNKSSLLFVAKGKRRDTEKDYAVTETSVSRTNNKGKSNNNICTWQKKNKNECLWCFSWGEVVVCEICVSSPDPSMTNRLVRTPTGFLDIPTSLLILDFTGVLTLAWFHWWLDLLMCPLDRLLAGLCRLLDVLPFSLCSRSRCEIVLRVRFRAIW